MRSDTCAFKLRPTLAALAMLIAASAPQYAMGTEGGGSYKALGTDTILAGVMAPPGLRLLTFVTRYEADETKNSAGDPRPGVSHFDLTVNALAFRLQYVWDGAKLWGADVETRIGIAPYAHGELGFDVSTPAGTAHRSGSAEGFGDLLLAPVLLGWHGSAYHQIAGLQFFLPTGQFDAGRLVNKGRGYASIMPAYWFTWFPADKVEVSGNLVYLFNFKNPDTDYKSGQEVALDYGLGYTFAPGWQTGLNGYLYKQVTDDKVNGRVVGDGNRGQVVAIGPFLRYFVGKDWGVTLKWLIEGDARNRSQGNRLLLQIALSLF